jgi:hypothetical protein
MNVFTHSRDANAQGAHFINVAGDHIIYNGPTTIYCAPAHSHLGSGCVPPGHHRPHGNRSQLTVTTGTGPQGKLLSTYRSADAIVAIKTALCLIDCIVDLLTDDTDSSNDHCDLKHKLEILRLILSLTEHAVFTYHGTPLRPSLDSAITPEVERCNMILSELHDEINGTWMRLLCTRIYRLWRQVWQRRWEEQELDVLRERLDKSENMLGMFLMALNSYVLSVFHALPLAEAPKISLKS